MTSESESDDNDEYLEEEEEITEDEECVDLFSDFVFGSVSDCVDHIHSTYKLDLRKAKDMYEWIRVVNYCRSSFKNGMSPVDVVASLHADWESVTRSDEWLTPVKIDDAFLYSYDSVTCSQDDVADKDAQIAFLQQELLRCKEKIRSMMEIDNDEPVVNLSVDQEYFQSYGHIGIHEQMLQDQHRTDSYRDAMVLALERKPGCKVLDIGCGTGILSLFAARGGASGVVGVDASNMLNYAQSIVKANKYNEVIKLIKRKVESIPKGNIEPVDVLVSEWMGYGLLFESMLDSVLVARDAWLKPGGIMIPSLATIFVQGQNDSKRFDYWNDVYGFDYSILAKQIPSEALVEVVDPSTIISDRAVLNSIDLCKVSKEELDFSKTTTITISKDTILTSIVITWDTEMLPNSDLVLTTAVEKQKTHWVQTILYLDSFLQVKSGDKMQIEISYKRNIRNCRAIDIDLVVNADHKKSFELK